MFTIDSGTGTGDLAIRIGSGSTDVSTPSLGSFGGGIPCAGSAGACRPGSSVGFFPAANGTVNLPAVDFNLRGSLTIDAPGPAGTIIVGHIATQGGNVSVTAPGGVITGNVQIGNGAANLSATNGALTTINVQAPQGVTLSAAGAVQAANVDVASGPGPVTITGGSLQTLNVAAPSNMVTLGAASGNLGVGNVHGGLGVTVASAPANGTMGAIDSGIAGFQLGSPGARIPGAVALGAVTANGNVGIYANGTITTGFIAAASSNVRVDGLGNVTVGGASLSSNANAAAVSFHAGSGLTVNGPVTVAAAGGANDASFIAHAAGGVVLNGAIAVTTTGVSVASAVVDVSASNGTLAVNANVTASAANGSSALIDIGTPTAAISSSTGTCSRPHSPRPRSTCAPTGRAASR